MEKDMLNSGAAMEVEFLEFRTGGNSYGISVNDIREILPYNRKPTPVPNSNPCIEGIIMPRDFIIPVINFSKSLKLSDTDEFKNEMLIVTSIEDLNISIHVDSVKGIHRIMSSEIAKPGKKLSTTQKEYVIGIFERDERKIEIIELRKMITDINPDLFLG